MRKLLIFTVSVFLFTSCNYDNKVTANPDQVVLKVGESTTVHIVGQSVFIFEKNYHLNDSICSVGNVKRKKFDVIGNKIGNDTLHVMYGQGIFMNGDYVEVPVTVVE